MDIQFALDFLGWCSAINIGILLFWIYFLVLLPEWTYNYSCRWIAISEENFKSIHFALIGAFKLGLFFFNLVPYFALRIIS